MGPVLSVALFSDLPALSRLNRGEIAALAGVAPFNCDLRHPAPPLDYRMSN
jgi:hypothetical protein